ncbi:transmembrane [Cyclospora cayetanensis]|uniref:Transmembrane n=1 Tax=Cyclospora cayetanensis TaxID=88456 RepID=A0A1D3D898_9EIME|nr:transmembrane [Cyclospora cayetanensis]
MGLIAFWKDTTTYQQPPWEYPVVDMQNDEGVFGHIGSRLFSSDSVDQENNYDSLSYLGVFLLPVLYVVFTARARASIRSSASKSVSIEAALQGDLALSLSLDFLDIAIMFNDTLGTYALLQVSDPGSPAQYVCMATLILTLVGVMTLGFAFPVQQSLEGASGQADIFVSAKYEFLVGLLLVDFPYLALRLYWMLTTPDKVLWFFLKNIFTIFVRPLKLNQCRLAERERAKGTQRSMYESPTDEQNQLLQLSAMPSSVGDGKQQVPPQQQQPPTSSAATAAASVGRGVLENIQRLRQRGSFLLQRHAAAAPLSAGGAGGNGAENNKDRERESLQGSREFIGSYLPSSSAGTLIPYSSAASMESLGVRERQEPLLAVQAQKRQQRLSRRQRRLVRDLQSSRRLPISGVGFGRVLFRLLVLLFSWKSGGLKTVLDGNPYLSYGQQLRLAVAAVFLDVLHVVLVLVGFVSFAIVKGSPPFEYFPVSSFQQMDVRDRTMGVVWVVSVAVCFVSSLFTVPILDSAFSAFCFGTKQLSRLLLYRQLGLAYLDLDGGALLSNGSIVVTKASLPKCTVGLMLAICFLAKPIYNLLTMFLVFPFSLCGKQYYTLHSDKFVKNTATTSSQQNDSSSSPAPRFVSLSNMVVFSLCRKAAAPLAFHALLIGPDTTKGIRVCEGLLDAMWMELLLTGVFRTWAVCICLSWYNFGVFCGHLLVGVVYLLLSQAVRIMALRRYELKAMLEGLVTQRTDDFGIFRESDSSEEEQQRSKRGTAAYAYITVADDAELYRRDGYLSSPGFVFPRVI